jgi:hypothetical protein
VICARHVSDDLAIIHTIIRETGEQEARRSAISWRIVEEGRYDALDRRWQARVRTGR